MSNQDEKDAVNDVAALMRMKGTKEIIPLEVFVETSKHIVTFFQALQLVNPKIMNDSAKDIVDILKLNNITLEKYKEQLEELAGATMPEDDVLFKTLTTIYNDTH